MERKKGIKKSGNKLLQAGHLETIGAFAGGIAHDFNNILAVISGYAEMLQDDLSDDPVKKEKTEKILSAVSKARSLTDAILTFIRRVDTEKKIIEVNEIVKETNAFLMSVLPADISIKTSFSENTITVFADSTQLFRVFLNLMMNAVHSIESKTGTISISTKVVNAKEIRSFVKNEIIPDEYALIRFEDTGNGMDDITMQKLFEPFYTNSEAGEGTGLGLSVVYRIVSDLEGEIKVSSKKNEGSVFNVYLPVFNEDTISETQNVGKKQILFISSKKHASGVLSKTLENSGFNLIYASDRKHLEKIIGGNACHPDLIVYITDSGKLNVHVISELVREFHIKTPFILITGKNEGKIEEELVNSEIVKYRLVRPVSLKELVNAIQVSITD